MPSDDEIRELETLRAEVADLRTSERVYRSIVEASRDLIWAVDTEGRITFVNHATCIIYNREPREMIGSLFSDFVAEPERDAAAKRFAEAMRARTDRVDVLTGVSRKDGSVVMLATNAHILRDDAGVVVGCVGVSRDVTATKQAERVLIQQVEDNRSLVEALSLERRRLAEAQSVASVGSWEMDLETSELNWSDETYRIFEMEKAGESLSYGTFLSLVHPDDRAKVDRTFVDSVANRVPYAVDHRILLPDGRVKTVHERCQTFYDSEGRALRSLGTAQDVTERRAAEAALYESRQALRAVLDSVPIRVFWKDCNSVYLGCNRPFALDMGFDDPNDVVGRTDYDASWKASAELYRADDRRVISSGETRLSYEEPMDLDGRSIWLRTSKVPLRGRDGEVSGLLGTYEDITERKRLEEQLAHAQRLESIGTLAAGMAHEINNPLTYVIGNVEVCREWVHEIAGKLSRNLLETERAPVLAGIRDDIAAIEESLRDASDGAARVGRLVLDIKSMARASDTSRQPRDLQTVIESAVKMTAHAVRHSARVTTTFGATPLVEASDGPLVQVFTNLLMNAAQAIGEGHADANEITLTTSTDARGWVCVEVRDTGPGIPADVLPRIFDPFFTTKPVGAGMGLGLSTCHNIVAGLGGTLAVDGARGRGAVFRLALPATSAVAVCAPSTRSSVAMRRGRVLVIDDESSVGHAIARILRDDHDVTMLTDGREALALLAAETGYDLIFCDLMMPNVSGIEVYRSIFAANRAQASKVVFMTGGAFTTSAQEFLDEVGRVHIAKPFTVDSIRTIAADCVV